MNKQTISIILVTRGHLLKCFVPLNGQRVLDRLNESSSDFLDLSNIDVYRLPSNEHIQSFSTAIIRKSNILLAILTDVEHEAPERRNNTFTPKNMYDAFVTMGNYEVYGKLHLRGKPDMITFLTHEAGSFLPLSKAHVYLQDHQEFAFRERTIIVSKSEIDLIQIAEAEPAESDILARIRELINESSVPAASVNANSDEIPAF